MVYFIFVALPCPTLELPIHSLNKDMKESKMYNVDQIVDFKCKQGYNLIGNGTLKCTFKRSSKVVDWDYDDKQICLGMFMLNILGRMEVHVSMMIKVVLSPLISSQFSFINIDLLVSFIFDDVVLNNRKMQLLKLDQDFQRF